LNQASRWRKGITLLACLYVYGVTFTAKMGKHMNLEFGGAVAFLGDAGRAIYNAPSTKRSVNKIFARL
jgi:hypothetical protein